MRCLAAVLAFALTGCLLPRDKGGEELDWNPAQRNTPGALRWFAQHCHPDPSHECWIEPFRGPPSASGPQDTPFAVLPYGTRGTVPLMACDYTGTAARRTRLTTASECWGDYGQLVRVWLVGGIVPPNRSAPPGMVELHEYGARESAVDFTYRTGDTDPSNDPPGAPHAHVHRGQLGWVISAYEGSEAP